MIEEKSMEKVLQDPKEDFLSAILSKVKFGESYVSLLLGIFVVIFVSIFVTSFIRTRNVQDIAQHKSEQEVLAQQTEKKNVASNQEARYTVVEGDSLWIIAEKYYQSGYRWVDIEKANTLQNPDLIEIGMELKIPVAESSILATNTVAKTILKEAITEGKNTQAITGDTYTVQRGDDLWHIAIRAYGDGYKWVEIVRANNLSNPDLIFSENVFKIPRS